tara:strand:+ start:45 stop:965 length:921 start_codon:yes stop_codon:yes gene_type:complete
MSDVQEALENADEIAALTGRDKSDIIADLLDDGKLNNSNAIKENTSAIDKATHTAEKVHKLLVTLIPILLLVATSGLELGGIIDFTPAGSGDDEWAWEEEHEDKQWGCMDSSANNYESWANEDDGSCNYQIEGCTDDTASNYNPEADLDDGSCEHEEEPIYGCMDSEALNYNDEATEDDGTCEYEEPEPEPEPEPEVECEPFFYDNYTNFLDNNTKIRFSYDVDLTCDETQTVQVQFLAYHENNTNGPDNYSIDSFDVYNGDAGYRNITLGNFTNGVYNIYAYLINNDGEMITELIWTGIEIEGDN